MAMASKRKTWLEYKAEFDKMKPEDFDRLPSLSADTPITMAYLDILRDWILDLVKIQKDQASARMDALQTRITELEQRPAVAYEGVWASEKAYSQGTFVTHAGGLWHCNSASIGVRPGTTPAWTLAVKRGADGRSTT